ncbi:hypothetical protein N7528_008096 [Penicillium herquei]|nr:hypothetical protein N7528_008096 [Penicillium herquei]
MTHEFEGNDFESTFEQSKTQTHFPEMRRTSGAATDSSGYSVNCSCPSTPTDSNFTMASELEMPYIKTYQPYDIEEPDDDSDLNVAAQRVELLSLPDGLEGWQRDLMHCIDDSGNEGLEDHHTNPSSLFELQKRGHKRRNPSFLVAEHEPQYQDHRPILQVKSDNRPVSTSGSSPKQRRKRNKVIDDSNKVAPMVSLYDFRDTQVSPSSSSDLSSADDSADAVADEMDID